jgi:hypothetical protein
MGGETAWNMYSIDSNKEYCITLHLVGTLERKNCLRHIFMIPSWLSTDLPEQSVSFNTIPIQYWILFSPKHFLLISVLL